MSKVYKQINTITGANIVAFGGGGAKKKKKKKKRTLNTAMSGPAAHSESQNTSNNPYKPISANNSNMHNNVNNNSKESNTNLGDTVQHIAHHTLKDTKVNIGINSQSGASVGVSTSLDCTSCHNISDPYAQ